jgi:crossover junction endodeoxyribonuclease RuvC
MITCYVGIDPGVGGAIAFLTLRDDRTPAGITVLDVPTLLVVINGKNRRVPDLHALADTFLSLIKEESIRRITIEEPHALPGQGVTSSFSFGFICGVLQMGAAVTRHPVLRVRPATWKAAMRVTADKDQTRRAASERFPEWATLWANKKDDGRAEAVLLAAYGSLQI